MLYVISVLGGKDAQALYYRVFDRYSESVATIKPHELMAILLNTKIHVVNAKVVNSNIEISAWPNGIHREITVHENNRIITTHSGANYVLLAESKDKYKVVYYNGFVSYLWENELRAIVEKGEVSNCCIIPDQNGDKQLEATDIYKIQTDLDFEQAIDLKYASFIAKTLLLGYKKLTFRYVIENADVKLQEYTGKSQHIILPPFVTVIMKYAFMGDGVATVTLGEGLRTIGAGAFSGGSISRVEIPESVEFIGDRAFNHNNKLFNDDGAINRARFIVRNSKTVVLRQGDN